MNSLTRRTVLTLAGVAGFKPLFGSAAEDKKDDLPNRCRIVVRDGIQIWIKNKLLRQGTSLIPIKYEPVDGDAHSFLLYLPWSSHAAIRCPKTVSGKRLMQHTFIFEAVKIGTVAEIKKGGGEIHQIRITCEATYEDDAGGKEEPKSGSCTFDCDGQPVVVPAGHSYVCHGVEYMCPARDGKKKK